VCRPKHVELHINMENKNSDTLLQLVGFFFMNCTMMHGSTNIKFIIVFTSLPLVPLLSQINAVYDLLSHFFKIHINVLPPTQFSSPLYLLP